MHGDSIVCKLDMSKMQLRSFQKFLIIIEKLAQYL